MGMTDNNTANEHEMDTDRALHYQNLRETMSSIKHKFLFLSSQKGVGKTSVAVNLAMALSMKGLKVGLMDVDFYRPDISKMLGLEFQVAWNPNKRLMPAVYSDNFKVASIASVIEGRDQKGIWKKPLEVPDIRSFISKVNWGNLEYLFIDTPPGPGEKLLAVIRDIPEAKAIIVTAPNKISSNRAKEMINFFELENVPIFGWIENMSGFLCQHCGQRQELFSSGSASRAIFLMDIPFLGRIPIDPYLPECMDAGESFMKKYPDSQAAEAYDLIVGKVRTE